MNINVTQRQASLTIMIASSVTALGLVFGSLFVPNFPVHPVAMLVATAVLWLLTVAYWRGWESASWLFSLLTPFMLALAVPVQAFESYISVAFLLPAIIALVVAGVRWVGVISVLTWFLLAYLSGWEGALVRPAGVLTSTLCILGLIVSRLIVETAQRKAEESAKQAEIHAEGLQLAESRYRIVARLISDYAFAYIVDEAGHIEREWTTIESFEHLTGFDRDDRRIGGIYGLYQPHDQARVHADVQRVIQGHEVIGEYEIIKKNGEKRWLSIHRYPVWNDQKTRVVKFYGAAQDITHRKIAEEKLAKERQLLRTLIDSLPDNITVKDVDGKFILNNRQSMLMRGVSTQEEILGKTDFDFYPPEQADEWLKNQLIAMQTGIPTIEKEYFQPFSDRRWVLGSLIPFYDDQGTIAGVIGINRDITERKLSEERLRESEERYRLISELISDYAYAYHITADGAMEHAWTTKESFERLTGYQSEEILDNSLYHPEERARVVQDVAATVAGKTTSAEYRIVTKSGEHRQIFLTRRPVWSEAEGRVVRVYGAAQDITERKRIEAEILKLNSELEQRIIQRTAQLQAANHELEAFTYSVSHDLRAPLRAIDGFSRTVVDHFAANLPEKAHHYLQRIQANAQRMSALIDDLLALSRLGQKVMQVETVNVQALVARIITDMKNVTNLAKVEFVVSPLNPCQADASLLEQVFVNLISNGVKYSSKVDQPKIEIGCITKRNVSVYFVRDNGAGFDMQYADKLFGVFQRLHSEADFEGTGIGLAIVKRIITRHGGKVWAESQVNLGATFYFTVSDMLGGVETPVIDARSTVEHDTTATKGTIGANPIG